MRAFPFDFRVQRQSCVLRASKETLALLLPPDHIALNETPEASAPLLAFCKGSIDAVAALCPGGLPLACRAVHDELAAEGAYVLALAWKCLPPPRPTGPPQPPTPDGQQHQQHGQRPTREKGRLCSSCLAHFEAQELRREAVECELQFLGLLLLSNELRPDAKETILQLRGARVRPVIITGDSVFTAAAVALRCGMLSPDPTAAVAKTPASAQATTKRAVREAAARAAARAAATGQTRDSSGVMEAKGGASKEKHGKEPPLLIGEASREGPPHVVWRELGTQRKVPQCEVSASPEVRPAAPAAEGPFC